MKKLFLAAIALTFGLATASAQNEYVEAPYGFIGVRGGVQSISLKENGKSKISPSAGISLGTMFNDYLGARLDFTGIWNKFEAAGVDCEYKTITGDLDLLLNLTNCFRADKNAPFNLYLLGGAGLIGNLDDPAVADRNLIKDWYNYRAGLIADYRLSRITSLNLEVDGNYMGGSESTVCGDGKWKLAAYLGLAFRLPFNESAPKVKKALTSTASEAPVTSQNSYDEAAAQAAQAAAAAAAAKKAQELEKARKAEEAKAKAAATAAAAKKAEEAKPIDETIFFTIGKTDSAEKYNQVVEAAAAWCKKNEGKTITVAGYADKGTGSAAVNARVAKQRATNVANAIKKKGVPADQIKVTSHGDKVQPFADNDQNRCVIVTGK